MTSTASSTASTDQDSYTQFLHELPDFFAPDEWLVLFSLTSIVICPVSPDGAKNLAEAAFLEHGATIDNESFRTYFTYVLRLLPKESLKGIQYMLNLMAQDDFYPKLVSWSTSGSIPFHHKPREERKIIFGSLLRGDEAVMKFPPLRGFVKTVMKLTLLCWLRSQSRDTTKDEEMVLEPVFGIEYPQRHKLQERDLEQLGTNELRSTFLDLRESDEHAAKQRHTVMTGTDENGTEWKVIHTDVVIVGSGAGGGVVAREVALAGHRCLVVEKGSWYPNNDLPLRETDAVERMYDGVPGLFMSSETDQVAILAGSTFGGGTQINWGVSLHPQNMVREKDWAMKQGLHFFMSKKFEDDIESVCNRIGVTAPTTHNHRNTTLLEGARKLGYHAQALPQNCGSGNHSDGYCTLGCGGDYDSKTFKNGTAQTYLVDAAQFGAEFLQQTFIERVIIEDGVAKGVEGLWNPPSDKSGQHVEPIKVRIWADRVVMSAGAIQTPTTLLRSQVQNENIGKNLKVHPSILVFGVFPESTQPLEGASTTAIITEFENIDGEGHGAKIECSSMIPALFLTLIPWTTPEEWKRKVLQYKNMDVYLSLVRDKECGRVLLGPSGRPRIDYVVSDADRLHIIEGIIGASKVAYTQGATEIFTVNSALRTFVRKPQEPESEDMGILNTDFQEWVEEVRKVGLQQPTVAFGSAHQMGSCKMGLDPETSVVDSHGKVWGVEGLYIADASVLPSATGVNPMVTIMATAQWIARALVEGM